MKGKTGRMDVLAEVTPAAFLNQDLDFGILGKITNCRVLSVTTVSDFEQTGFDFSSRSYAPAVGVDEDPVCGSAHCFLGPHWVRSAVSSDVWVYFEGGACDFWAYLRGCL